MLWGAGFYTSFVWMAIYMKVLCNPPYKHGFWINAMALLFGIIIPLPLTGMLSDKIGRDKTMGIGVVGAAISGPFMIRVISSGKSVPAFFAQWTLGIFLSFFAGPMVSSSLWKRGMILSIETFSTDCTSRHLFFCPCIDSECMASREVPPSYSFDKCSPRLRSCSLFRFGI